MMFFLLQPHEFSQNLKHKTFKFTLSRVQMASFYFEILTRKLRLAASFKRLKPSG